MSRISETSGKVFLAWSKLVSHPRFSTPKQPKSRPEFVLLDAILRGFLTDRAATNFWSRFYIDLRSTPPEFFCSLSVQS
jgi:hypothetical protein